MKSISLKRANVHIATFGYMKTIVLTMPKQWRLAIVDVYQNRIDCIVS